MANIAVIDSIKKLIEQLHNRYSDIALCTQTAWWMLEAITKKTKSQLIALGAITLTDQQKKTVDDWIDLHINQHKPLQYILGSVPFGDIEILVEPPTLIPRPETEEWCIDLIAQIKKIKTEPLIILDMCSGSGCIALVFAHAFPKAHVYALDISPRAIKLGMTNAQHNNISNVTFIESDLFTHIPEGIQFDLIVTNPPYIPNEQWLELDASVTQWEDPKALITDDAGLKIIKLIIAQASHYLRYNPHLKQEKIPQLVIEIDPPQTPTVLQLLQRAGFVDIASKKDLEGKERIVIGSLANVANTKDNG